MAIWEDERIGVLRSLNLLDTAASEDFDQFTRLAAYTFDVPTALISLVDTDRQQFLSSIGFALRETSRATSICAVAIQQADLFEVEDLSRDPRFADNPLVTGPPFIRFYAGVPLITESGHAIGALCLIDSRPRVLDDAARAQLKAMGKLVMEKIMLRQSAGRRDSVSGLPNRQQMIVDLESLKAVGGEGRRRLALIELLSLATVHEMAQAVGVPVAESLMRHAAGQARHCLPPHVAVYQVGVTRLAFWYDPSAEPDLMQGIADVARRPLVAAGIPLQLRPHCGMVDFDLSTVNAPDVLRQAMTALNSAINADLFSCIYDLSDDTALRRRYELAVDLSDALAHGGFHLVYQPRVNLHTGKVGSVEALVRWQHPVHGAVSPAEFIPIIERTAIMQKLTLWVVDAALRQLLTWLPDFPALKVSLNLSPRDFDNGELVPGILRLCQAIGIAPARLEFEITEGEWLHASASVQSQLHALADAGATLSVDDFGAGYSNFANLHKIPAAVLKLDQSLVTDVATNGRHAVLVREVLRLARNVGYRTVAEGVESAQSLAFVTECGCDEVQGFFFSRPLAPDAVPGFIRGFTLPLAPSS